MPDFSLRKVTRTRLNTYPSKKILLSSQKIFQGIAYILNREKLNDVVRYSVPHDTALNLLSSAESYWYSSPPSSLTN
jgi:hypothetical protein